MSRQRYPYDKPAEMREIVGSKSYYTIERWGRGWAINIHRRGCSVETVLCDTPGHVNQMRTRLTDAGLIGINGGAE